jgi:hypothetical protein
VNISKNASGYIRYYILGLPSHSFIHKSKWGKYTHDCDYLVEDEEDLPHICAYFTSGCEYFVTTNRRLTKMKVKEKVNFISPKKFVERVLGLKGLDTIDKI